jgi:hypothetical protein
VPIDLELRHRKEQAVIAAMQNPAGVTNRELREVHERLPLPSTAANRSCRLIAAARRRTALPAARGGWRATRPSSRPHRSIVPSSRRTIPKRWPLSVRPKGLHTGMHASGGSPECEHLVVVQSPVPRPHLPGDRLHLEPVAWRGGQAVDLRIDHPVEESLEQGQLRTGHLWRGAADGSTALWGRAMPEKRMMGDPWPSRGVRPRHHCTIARRTSAKPGARWVGAGSVTNEGGGEQW